MGSLNRRNGVSVNTVPAETTTASSRSEVRHPELVPDDVAYRLFFLTVAEAEDATDQRKARQRAYLRTAGLDEEDLQRAARILATFRIQYDDLVAQYNESVRERSVAGLAPDLDGFLTQQDEVIESTRDALKADLSAPGMARLEAHVQREKKNMKVAKEDR